MSCNWLVAVVMWAGYAQALHVAVFALAENCSSVLVWPSPLYVMFRMVANCLNAYLTKHPSISQGMVARAQLSACMFCILMMLVCSRVQWVTSKAPVKFSVIACSIKCQSLACCIAQYLLNDSHRIIKGTLFGTNSISLVCIGLEHCSRDQFSSHQNQWAVKMRDCCFFF